MTPNVVMCLLVLGVVSKSLSLPVVGENDKELNESRIWLVTTVHGKSYFAEAEPPRSWNDADAYCKSMGMGLASFTTPEQHNAVRLAYDKQHFNGEFWTSATTIKGLKQFGWYHGSNLQPGNFLDFGGQDIFFFAYVNGLTIKIDSGRQGKVYGKNYGKEFGTLCETK